MTTRGVPYRRSATLPWAMLPIWTPFCDNTRFGANIARNCVKHREVPGGGFWLNLGFMPSAQATVVAITVDLLPDWASSVPCAREAGTGDLWGVLVLPPAITPRSRLVRLSGGDTVHVLADGYLSLVPPTGPFKFAAEPGRAECVAIWRWLRDAEQPARYRYG